MTVSRERYEQAYTFSDYASQVSKHEGLWDGIYRPQVIPEDALQRLRELPGQRHVLVVAEDWCGDAASLVPVLAKMVDSAPEFLDLRILKRDENLDIMDSHLSHGGRAIPVAMVLDAEMRELGWWGPRPAPAQALLRRKMRAFKERGGDKNSLVYRPILNWYREDRGRHLIDEFLTLLEREGELRE